MKKEIWGILIRYALLILIAIPGFWYFYYIFTPLTLYPTAFLLNAVYDSTICKDSILLGSKVVIQIIGACVAGSAYYFLLILNLSVPKIKISRRVMMILFSFVIFLIINILRIFILSLMYVSESSLFETLHKTFWYVGSIFFVILIWFLEVKIFKIKEIPFYSDLKTLYKKSVLGKKQRKNA